MVNDVPVDDQPVPVLPVELKRVEDVCDVGPVGKARRQVIRFLVPREARVSWRPYDLDSPDPIPIETQRILKQVLLWSEAHSFEVFEPTLVTSLL